MLVDLARNDLLKVCTPGTVEVTEFMQVERFSHIMHLVSSVEGDLRPDASQWMCSARPSRPAPSRARRSRERSRSSTSSNPPSAASTGESSATSISRATSTSRSRFARRRSSAAWRSVQAGAGLVADSDPQLELEETQNKAAAPLRAVAVANAMRRMTVTPRRLKSTSILAGLALSALTMLAWTQVWFTVTLESRAVAIAGDVAAPALAALALSGLALAAALAIAGPVFRVILGALQAAIGALVVTSAAIALADPIAASAAAVTAVTGVSGADSVAALVLDVSATAWPLSPSWLACCSRRSGSRSSSPRADGPWHPASIRRCSSTTTP